MFRYKTKREIAENLDGQTIRRVEFGPGRKGADHEIRSLILRLDNGEHVAFEAKAWQAIEIGAA